MISIEKLVRASTYKTYSILKEKENSIRIQVDLLTLPPKKQKENKPTYHKSAKGSPPPCPQISWEPQINE